MSDGKWKKGQSGNPATQWKPGESGNKKGRKYKTIRQWLKDLSKCHDVEIDITKKYLSKGGNEQVKREYLSLTTNEPSKTINAVIASQLIAGAMQGNLNYIKEYLNRTEGKPEDDSSDEDSPDNIPPMITFTTANNANGSF